MENVVVVPKVYYNYKQTENSIITKKKCTKDVAWAVDEFHKFAHEHNIELGSKKDGKIEYIKIFNMTFLKICYSKNSVKYKLFGFIPFITKTTV